MTRRPQSNHYKGPQGQLLGFALLLLATMGSSADAALSFTVGGAWPNTAHRDAAVDSMQQVVDRYNSFGNFGNYNVYVYYNAGIPTAQASYLGSIGFGGTYPNQRVTQHELGHYLGLPSGNWDSLMSGGAWSGSYGDQLVKQFDGESANISGDGIHFWPYGLNYDSEGSQINLQRQTAIVYAMRADLGIGSARYPSSVPSVSLTASDPTGQSGFNYMDRWSDGYFAHAGADYSTGNYSMRTPQDSDSFTFAGGSLTVEGSSPNSGLYFAGQGSNGVVTVDDLILDGGWVQHYSGVNDFFQLDGSLTVVSDSNIRAKQGNINLLGDLHGDGSLTVHPSDNITQDNRYVRLHSSNNTFVGDLINESRFELTDTANFKFSIGSAGMNNAISGAGAQATLLNGAFDFDFSNAGDTVGDSWNLVTAANTSYGSSFHIPGFVNESGNWTNDFYSFSTATGILQATTPPPMWNIDGGGLWSDYNSWSSAPPTAGQKASFGSVLTSPNAPATITLDVNANVKAVAFNNANQYRIVGTNTLTFTGISEVRSESGGSHEIAVPVAGSAGITKAGGGQVTFSGVNPYSGSTLVKEGTLALAGAGSIANSPSINVSSNATFDVSATATVFQLGNSQTLHSEANATIAGDVSAVGGATVTGSGIFENSLSMQSGATLQVGGASLPQLATLRVIDDFQGYSTSSTSNIGAHSSGDATNGAWDGVFDGTSNARIVSARGSQGLQVYGIGSGWRGAVTDLSDNFSQDHSLADGETATYFVQFMREGTSPIDGLFGLVNDTATLDTSSSWQDFSVMGVVAGSSGSTTSFAVHGENGTGGTVISQVQSNAWYNVWFVVDNAAKEFDVYSSDANGDAMLVLSGVEFGRVTDPTNLDAFGLIEQLAGSNPENAALRIDNLSVIPGVHLLNPLSGPMAAYLGETLTIDGDLMLSDNTTILAMNLANSDAHDQLIVAGTATLAGTLQISLTAGNVLGDGDTFDLFNFGTTAGVFDALNLPALDAGLSWDTSSLYSEGILAVIEGLAGDYNDDGMVDAADYTVWRDNFGAATLPNRGTGVVGIIGLADYDVWVSQFGNVLSSSSISTASVPEPSTTSLLLILLAMFIGKSRPSYCPCGGSKTIVFN